MGWEETISGFGRPQYLINKEVDRCDLFLGMIWKRWGTPPDLNGQYTSGFQEEFVRSVERRKRSGKPEISLFFKKINDAFLVDIGPDLKKVLEFKEKIIAEKQILFQNFSEKTDIKTLVRKCISHYVTEIRKEDLSETNEKYGKKTKEKKQSPNNANVSSALTINELQFLEKFVSEIRSTESFKNLKAVNISRFRLIANSINNYGNDDNSLGVHDINLLYADRENQNFGRIEINNLISLGFQKIYNENVPIWYWYSLREKQNIDQAIIYSFIGNNEFEMSGAIRVLTLLDIKLPEDEPVNKEFIVSSWFSDKSAEKVKNAALEYFKINGGLEDLTIIKSVQNDSVYSLSLRALESIVCILLRAGEKVSAAKNVIDTNFYSIDKNILEKALEIFVKLDRNYLIKGLEHQNSLVRLQSLRVLDQKESLDIEILKKLTKDGDSTIRYEALKRLVNRGENLSNEEAKNILVRSDLGIENSLLLGSGNEDKKSENYYDQFVFDRLSSKSESELLKLKNASLIYDDSPYFSLTQKYFTKYSKELRENVDDKFNKYFFEQIERVDAIGNTEKIKVLVSKLKKHKDTITKGLMRKGLDILCENNSLEDIKRIRQNLKTSYTGVSIFDAKYIEKNGNWNDIELLAKACSSTSEKIFLGKNNIDEFNEAVAKAIYIIGKNKISDLFLMKFPSDILIMVIKFCSFSVFKSISDEVLFNLFDDENDQVRKAVVLISVRTFTKKRLRVILDKYLSIENKKTYYNVIHWLDLGISMTRSESNRIANLAYI
jgi:hypothetical protein